MEILKGGRLATYVRYSGLAVWVSEDGMMALTRQSRWLAPSTSLGICPRAVQVVCDGCTMLAVAEHSILLPGVLVNMVVPVPPQEPFAVPHWELVS